MSQVLGEMSVPGMTKEVKKAINSGTSKVEKLMDFGSSSSLNKVKYKLKITVNIYYNDAIKARHISLLSYPIIGIG